MRVYLDHNATTPMRPEVLEAMLPFMQAAYGNASSVHSWGSQARCAVEEARIAVASALGVEPAEVVFTSGGTESNNLAVIGGALGTDAAVVAAAPVEHSSVLAAGDVLRSRRVRVVPIPVDSHGRIDLRRFEALELPAGSLVSIGWANNEVGTVQPLPQLSDLCARRKWYVHVDAVQAFGKIPVRVGGIDLLSLSAHKIGGPKGAGALFVRRGLPLQPMQVGGSQERGHRAGTENVPAIVGFGRAAELAANECSWFGEACVGLRDRLWSELQQRIAGVHRNGPDDGLPNTLNIRFDGVRGEALVAALDLEGIAVSSGSACAAGAAEPSHVLMAMGLDEEVARDGVRFSLGRSTTPADIDAAVGVTVDVVKRMRGSKRSRER